MSTEPKRQLEQELRGKVAALADLTDNDAATLVQLIRNAHATERAAFVDSINQTVAGLPWALRGPVRAIVFGGLK